MILRDLFALWTSYAPKMADHLWQSTLFVVLAAILAFTLRKNQGRVRYWVWLTASVKFLIPFSLLIALGSHLAKPRASTPAQAVVYSAVEDFSQPFAGPVMPMISEAAPSPAPASRFHLLPPIIVAVWLAGIIFVLVRWVTGWFRVLLMVRRAVPLGEGPEVDALRRLESSLGIRKPTRMVLSQNCMEPGIFGIFRPVLIWPEGISQHLDDRHVKVILAHEICYARRHDNFTAILHMLVEAAFWFHPLVWWMGARLEEERERACDEEVSLLCRQPQIYAESILRVCKFCSESPLACVSGITGADLKKRIVEIMRARAVLRLTWEKKMLIGAAMVCAIAVPVMLGQAKAAERMAAAMLRAAPAPVRSVARAMMEGEQTSSKGEIAEASPTSVPDSTSDPCSTTQGATFDVVSIKPSKAFSGDWDSETSADGVSLSGTTKALIQEAFGLRDFQVNGGPDWIASDTFDIKAKFDVPEKPTDDAAGKAAALRWTQRYRSLLQEQFQFRCHMATKELPVYNLVVAKGGAKLKPATAGGNDDSTSGHGDAHKKQVIGTGVGMEHMVEMLARYSGRTVVDKTSLTGKYDFVLNWSTERQAEQSAQDGEPSLPELPTALEEQLGLKLVPSKGPVPVLVIDHIEKPTVDGAEVQPAAAMAPVAQDAAGQHQTNGSAQPQMMAKNADPDWEVVTVKPSAPSDEGDYMDMHGRHWTFERETVEEMLGIGYDVQKRQLAGEPDWARTDRWDVDGLSDTDGEPDLEQVQSMMRKVLAERFGLKLHNEQRQMPVFALTVAKGGPKLTENTTDPNGTMDQNGGSGNGWKSSRFSDATMQDLALILNFHVDRPVVDQTGLKARYDFRLKWLTDDSHATDPDAPPGIFTAIQEQLGLKLEPAKALADVVVIDKVERPGAN